MEENFCFMYIEIFFLYIEIAKDNGHHIWLESLMKGKGTMDTFKCFQQSLYQRTTILKIVDETNMVPTVCTICVEMLGVPG